MEKGLSGERQSGGDGLAGSPAAVEDSRLRAMQQAVQVRVPATSANLGPGLDTLGMALELHNVVRVECGPLLPAPAGAAAAWERVEVRVQGCGEGILPQDDTNLVARSMAAVFSRCGLWPRWVRIEARNNVPVWGGLGSSATAVVAGIWAADALLPGLRSRPWLLSLASHLEGHPDNVAAAVHGGVVVAMATDGPDASGGSCGEGQVGARGNLRNTDGNGLPEIRALPLSVPYPWDIVLLIPHLRVDTAASRRRLPDQVPLADAVFNVQRAAALVAALQNGRAADLQQAMRDRLHQPYRLPHIPGAEEASRAALTAGALGVCLSGSGPTLLAFCAGRSGQVAAAMDAAMRRAGVEAHTVLTRVAPEGVRVEPLACAPQGR